MTARVLVVDDLPANVRLLEAKLTSEYFDVVTAFDGQQALEAVRRHRPDIVLLDVMMPGMDGFEVCRRLKLDPESAHIPVVMVTALSEQADRVHGLEAGADDFLTKPVDDVALFARVRSLVRLKMMMDELRLRERTGNQFGVVKSSAETMTVLDNESRLLVIEDCDADAAEIERALGERYRLTLEADCERALDTAREEDFDLVVLTLHHENHDSLRICSQLRSDDKTRNLPILAVVNEHDTERLVKALELGVNDYLIRPVEPNELAARVATQVRRKRYQDSLRQNYHLSLALAVTDGLTGLYNRRYMTSHLENLIDDPRARGKPIGLLMLDIDHFKSINDSFGHSVGDEVLREFAKRLRDNIRGVDLASRYGGEEFVVILPDADADTTAAVAERLLKAIGEAPFVVSTEEGSLTVTCSIGLAVARPGESPEEALKRADQGLYRAKRGGRNQLMADIAINPAAQRTAACL